MSLSKEKPIEDNLKRDSFSHRINDKLCEDILQYFTLEHKLRLESISKQFQRTIFQRHNEIIVSPRGERIEMKLLSFMCLKCSQCRGGKSVINLKAFESLLKKCSNLKSLYLDGRYRCVNYNEAVLLVVKHCHRLDDFRCPMAKISLKTFIEFQNRFKPQLKCCVDQSFNPNFDRLKRFPNLESLHCGRIEAMNQKDILCLKFDKIKSLEIQVSVKMEESVNKLMANFPQLNRLKLKLFSSDEKAVNSVLREVSKLHNLSDFVIHTEMGLNRKSFSNWLKLLANSCPLLKRIDTNLVIDQKIITEKSDVLSQLKAFKALKRLSLVIRLEGISDFEISVFSDQINEMLSFRGMSDLTHLDLEIDEKAETVLVFSVNEKLLTNIVTNSPKIQNLKIRNLVISKGRPIGDILSQLSALQKLEFDVTGKRIGDQIRAKLIEKCQKIRSIGVKVCDCCD